MRFLVRIVHLFNGLKGLGVFSCRCWAAAFDGDPASLARDNIYQIGMLCE